uniref:Uncharacterized protein n=1 Tax=Megaselia scalaris TaxID=36166 RepID=T1GJC6_MEGSC
MLLSFAFCLSDISHIITGQRSETLDNVGTTGLVLICSPSPALRKSEIEYYAMLEIQSPILGSSCIELGTAYEKYFRV